MTKQKEFEKEENPAVYFKLALEDFDKCFRDPSYTIDMWHLYDRKNKKNCTVCLAGAVLAKRFRPGVGRVRFGGTDLSGRWGDDVYAKLRAVDYFRAYAFYSGLCYSASVADGAALWNVQTVIMDKLNHDETSWRDDPTRWRKNMGIAQRVMAQELRKLNKKKGKGNDREKYND